MACIQSTRFSVNISKDFQSSGFEIPGIPTFYSNLNRTKQRSREIEQNIIYNYIDNKMVWITKQ